MAFAPHLYAVVPRGERPAPTPAPRKNITELRVQKHAELKAKQAIDRTDTILTRLEERVDGFSAQIEALKKRKALAEARIAHIESEALTRLDQAHLTRADGFRVAFTAKPCPPSVAITSEAAIPAESIREKITSAPDKTAIKKALIAGEEIPGARLVQGVSLVRQ